MQPSICLPVGSGVRKSRDAPPREQPKDCWPRYISSARDYANVKKYTGRVIARGEYSLHRDYRDLFNPNSYYSDEVMLADQYLWGESTERNLESEYVKWQGIRGEMGWGMFSPSEALDQAYEAGDPRRTATIFYDGETLEGKGEIHFKKEVPPRANKKTIWPTGYWNENSFAKQNCHLDLPALCRCTADVCRGLQ